MMHGQKNIKLIRLIFVMKD